MEANSLPAEGAEPEAGTSQENAQPDIGAVMQRLDQLNGRFDNIEPLLQGGEEEYEADEGEEGDEDFDFPGAFNELAGEDGVVDPEDLQGLISQAAEQIAEKKLSERDARLSTVEQYLQAQELNALTEKYPELQDDEQATALSQKVRAFAEARGIPELAGDPEFVEFMYLAESARRSAAQQTPAGTQTGPFMEGGSGASPGEPQEDPAQAILKAGGGGGGDLFR